MQIKDRRKKRRGVTIIVAIVIVFSILTLLFPKQYSFIRNNIFQNTLQTVEYYLFKVPIRTAQNKINEVKSWGNLHRDNQELMLELEGLEQLKAENQLLQIEIDRLKGLLDIEWLPTDYQLLNAIITSRGVDNWNNMVTINKGLNSGVEVGMIVANSQGMIGQVSVVNQNTSQVTLLTTEKSVGQLPVMIINGEDLIYGLVNQYDLEKNAYEVMLLENFEMISIGDVVVTSGLGDKIPSGILVGKVSEVTTKNNNFIIYVEPGVSFQDLQVVSVLQRNDYYEAD